MLTECPSCLTVFRVTGAILKMGRGQVRCGKCRKQFDALECMLEEDDVEIPPESANPSPSSEQNRGSTPSTPVFDTPTYAEEVTMEGSRIEISGTYRVPDEDNATQQKIVREHVVIDRGELPSMTAHAPNETSDYDAEEIIADVTDTELDPGGDDGEPVGEAAEHLLDDVNEPHTPEDKDDQEQSGSGEAPALPKRWRRALHVGRRKEHEEIHAELHALTQTEAPRVLRTGVWTAICVALVVVMIAQLIHHNRDVLVRDPRFGNTVSRLYRALGLSPTPHWDLAAYKWDIYKVGLDSKTPDALRVVGSVANNAPFAQPYPLGKLSLKDRWEAPVGVRAFEPYEYLPTPEAADRLMAPKQRANIEIVIADPGPDAVGYLIHACLEQDHRLTCADELPVFK
jgi:predicted Zn finger-like uncharacterized protein